MRTLRYCLLSLFVILFVLFVVCLWKSISGHSGLVSVGVFVPDRPYVVQGGIRYPVVHSKEVIIEPYTKPCVGLAERDCLVIDGLFAYEDINGFVHTEGYYEKVLVDFFRRGEEIQDIGIEGMEFVSLVDRIHVSERPSAGRLCTFYTGEWAPEVRECRVGGDAGRAYCENVGGVFGCLSPCRHDPGATKCIQRCDYVCTLPEQYY